MWPVDGVSRGALASGQNLDTEAYRLWHALIRWPNAGGELNARVFGPFELPCIFHFFLLVLHVFPKHTALCFATRPLSSSMSPFSRFCLMICLCKSTTPRPLWKPEPLFSFGAPAALRTSTPLKLSLQYTLHWDTAGRITLCPVNVKPAAASLLLFFLPETQNLFFSPMKHNSFPPRWCPDRTQELWVGQRFNKWPLYVHFYCTYYQVQSSLSTWMLSSSSNGLPINPRANWLLKKLLVVGP